MAIALKDEYKDNKVLYFLVENFNNSVEQHPGSNYDKYLSIIDDSFIDRLKDHLNSSINDLNDPIGIVKIDMLDFDYTDHFKKLFLFYNLQSFISIAKEKMGLKENFYLEKQKWVASPGTEAYEYMGNNSLNIVESKNPYSLIFE
jgi:hypothetical protein